MEDDVSTNINTENTTTTTTDIDTDIDIDETKVVTEEIKDKIQVAAENEVDKTTKKEEDKKDKSWEVGSTNEDLLARVEKLEKINNDLVRNQVINTLDKASLEALQSNGIDVNSLQLSELTNIVKAVTVIKNTVPTKTTPNKANHSVTVDDGIDGTETNFMNYYKKHK